METKADVNGEELRLNSAKKKRIKGFIIFKQERGKTNEEE